jgi:NAD(P)-dependent dehydrogenase (short-subunit alcohol dehydrogenase family)
VRHRHCLVRGIFFGHPLPYFSHSAASRGGMLTLSECAAIEWAESGVRVNTVAPGSIASAGLDTYDAKDTDFIRNDLTPGIWALPRRAADRPCPAAHPRPRPTPARTITSVRHRDRHAVGQPG